MIKIIKRTGASKNTEDKHVLRAFI